MNARYVVRITPEDIGARVTVRSRLPTPTGGPTTTDTLGYLRAWGDGVLEIERRDGSMARLAETDLVAGHRIPPPPVRPVWIAGRPAAALRSAADRAWRSTVAEALGGLAGVRGVKLDFTLAPRRWVDLDSLVEVAVAGLRDAGVTPLDALVATKREGPVSGLTVAKVDPVRLAAAPPPGPPAVTVEAAEMPLPGRREAKRALRDRLAAVWNHRPLVEGEVWADVAIATSGALLPAMEPALDTLEPVLGRDPRGQPRQEFFPYDDRITWLRVHRTPPDSPPLVLTVGRR